MATRTRPQVARSRRCTGHAAYTTGGFMIRVGFTFTVTGTVTVAVMVAVTEKNA